MKERPIIFSAPMVRAILAGAKSQTRRVVKYDWLRCLDPDNDEDRAAAVAQCPYAPVDRLWVRETWRPRTAVNGVDPDCADMLVAYAAGGPEVFFEEHLVPHDWDMPKAAKSGNVTSLHMPRWASRITLEITDVRVERLQSISEADIAAEGVTAEAATDLFFKKRPVGVSMPLAGPMRPIDAWRIGWSAINGAESWASDPWVWCLSFRRVER